MTKKQYEMMTMIEEQRSRHRGLMLNNKHYRKHVERSEKSGNSGKFPYSEMQCKPCLPVHHSGLIPTRLNFCVGYPVPKKL